MQSFAQRLDFMSVNMSSYVAGCLFQDALAHEMNREVAYPVKTINWGYWSKEHPGDSKRAYEPYESYLEKKGIYGLRAEEGMKAFECILAQELEQVIVTKVSDEILKKIAVSRNRYVTVFSGQRNGCNDHLIPSLPDHSAVLNRLLGEVVPAEALNALIINGILKALDSLGVLEIMAKPCDKEELRKQSSVLDKYGRLWAELMKILTRADKIEVRNSQLLLKGNYSVLEKQIRSIDIDRDGEQLLERYPILKSQLAILTASLKELPEILTGHMQATEVLFAHSSMERVEGIYKGNPSADYFNRRVADLVAASVKERSQRLGRGEKIRLLEIGAGTGGTSTFLFEALEAYSNQLTYVYTDISKRFLIHAEETFSPKYPFIEVQLLNIEEPSRQQGFEVGSFDIVVAANVLHATRDISTTLQHAKALLQRNGLLILNELCEVSSFLTVTFGLLDGWWLFEDEAVRLPGSPGLSPRNWKLMLKDQGFERIILLDQEAHALGQQIILAQSDGIICQGENASAEVTGQVCSAIQKGRKQKDNEKDAPSSLPAEASSLVEACLMKQLSQCIKIKENRLDRHTPFSDYGVDSILTLSFVDGINEELGITLNPAELFNYTTVERLTRFIVDQYAQKLPYGKEVAHLQQKSSQVKATGSLPAEISELVEACLMKQLSECIKIKESRLSKHTPFSDYGVDSILMLSFVDGINEELGITLNPAELFNYTTVERLTRFIADRYSQKLPYGKQVVQIQQKRSQVKATDEERYVIGNNRSLSPSVGSTSRKNRDIAIIGMSCQVPGAISVGQFWENLKAGTDSVSELPEDRLDRRLYDSSKHQEGKCYCKWGGILEEQALFDPLFFEISPKEATEMNPSQRLFLQEAYKALEDAGYVNDSQSGQCCGIYAGCESDGYLKQGFTGASEAIVASRLAYFLNLQGPALVINSGCSSSAVAVHLACESIRNGENDLALAGGVSCNLNSELLICLSSIEMLSPSGRCHTFDEAADGTVVSEGVGVVVLKRLQQALADKDFIYGVIKASGINQDGKSNGITAPNGLAQENLIRRVYQGYDIDTSKISYIEAHGTGTKLGDPVEANALKNIFYFPENGNKYYCGVGSVKSDIGHTAAAAGVIGLIKILLCLKHRQLPGLNHFHKLNPLIDLSESALYIVKKLQNWIPENGEPLMAGLNSFGHSGTNAHLVIQAPPAEEEVIHSSYPYYLVSLSAKNDDALKTKINDFSIWLEREGYRESLGTISYNLNTSRAHFKYRCILVVDSMHALKDALATLAEGECPANGLMGKVEKIKPEEQVIYKRVLEGVVTEFKRGLSNANRSAFKNNLMVLAGLYIKGYEIDWQLVYNGEIHRRISLPTYPFARERYWVNDHKAECGREKAEVGKTLHPLVHENTSDISQLRFSSSFAGDEFFLAEYVEKGHKVLPGAVYLEMAKAAVKEAIGSINKGQTGIQLKHIVWSRPITINSTIKEVHIGLFPEADGQIQYEVYTEYSPSNSLAEKKNVEKESMVHCQGVAASTPLDKIPPLDLLALQEASSQGRLNSGWCHKTFKPKWLDCGDANPSGIEEVYWVKEKVLARLTLSTSVDTGEEFILHNKIMDFALQASIGLTEDRDNHELILPLTSEKVEFYGRCSSMGWALIRYTDRNSSEGEVQNFDLDLCDDQGNVCVRWKGVTSRLLDGERRCGVTSSDSGKENFGRLMCHPIWKEEAIPKESHPPEYAEHLVMLCEVEALSPKSLEMKMIGIRFLKLQSNHLGIEKRFETYAIQAFEQIQMILQERSKREVLVQIVVCALEDQQLFSGLSGLLQTAHLENPKIFGQVIEVDSRETENELLSKLQEESGSQKDTHICYRGGKRYVKMFQEINPDPDSSSPVFLQPSNPVTQHANTFYKERGVYLITGGTGGLGMIFAKEIAGKTKNSTLILTGRSTLSQKKQEELKEIELLGAKAEYRQVNVADEKAVTDLMQCIQKDYSSLDGIIHGAGVLRDNYILKKTAGEFRDVLAPKVAGTVNLDLASKAFNLDFFVLFSSGAGTMGNAGQADYSTANAFMDVYARYRNAMVVSKKRQGQTLSLDWPLWKEGGMRMDEATWSMVRENTGMVEMATATGIWALSEAFYSGNDQVIVVEGDLPCIKQWLLGRRPKAKYPYVESSRASIDEKVIREKTLLQLKHLIGEIIHLSVDRIDSHEPLECFGLDSVIITKLNQKLEIIFGEIPKTLFYEYQTLSALAGYFVEDYPQSCITWTRGGTPETCQHKLPSTAVGLDNGFPTLKSLKSKHGRKRSFVLPYSGTQVQEPIAIIGISGHYAQADTLAAYWEHLKAGKNCITEIPPERWSLQGFFHEDPDEAVVQGKSYSKWGSFLKGFADFDTNFFNITPRQAMHIDPQERLFLQCSWEGLEDAGYTMEQLSTQFNGSVGVFAGITKTGFELYGPELRKQGENLCPITCFSSVANRVSYFLNLQGPSMPIDTMCSSSLTAIHEACEHLRHGDCELAIAGGVNLYLHPSTYIVMSAGKMLSTNGSCKSFGKGGDGFVPGEGVGVVLLKRLSRAIKDEDRIHAVIRGTSVNHGGKSNGYTVPNPKAQAVLIRETLEKSGVHARAVSYIEAHGTGTELGDTIEVTGLTQAFQKDTLDVGYCALGSAKSNLGHLEAAAGIAGLTKIVLQMKNRQLAPSLHATELNPNIQFNKTPFIVQQSLKEWKRPSLTINGETKEFPRIAAISSFGAGGSNAHVIIEEYENQLPVTSYQLPVNSYQLPVNEPVLIVLSAKDKKRLREMVKNLLDYLALNRETGTLDLSDVAYTLQVCREAMEERLGLIVRSVDGLVKKLNDYLEDQDDVLDLFRGQVKRNKEAMIALAADEDMGKIIDAWVSKSNYSQLLELWVKGMIFDWNKLYGDSKPHRISLPTYPFAKERYWISRSSTIFQQTSTSDAKESETGTSVPGSSVEDDPYSSEWAFSPAMNDNELISDSLNLGVKKKTKLFVQQLVADQIEKSVNEIDTKCGYFDLGLTSHHLLRLTQEIRNKINDSFSPTSFFEHSTLSDLISYLSKNYSSALDRLIITKKKHHKLKAEENKMRVVQNLHSQNEKCLLTFGPSGSGNTPTIIPNLAEKYHPFPLSDIQESFLSGRKLGLNGRVGCHIYFEMEIGDLDIYRLNMAWNSLINYHEMLRAVVLSSGQQKIQKETPLYEFKVIDLRIKSDFDQGQYLQNLRERMSHKVYEPDQWPLFEIRISICPDKQIIHFSIDELIVDAFSLQMLFQQWQKLYKEPDWQPPKLNISFRDYILAVKEFESSKYYKNDLDYWLNKLEKMPQGPQLPLRKNLDHPSQNGHYVRVRLEGTLEREHWQVLKKNVKKLNVSPTVLLLNVFTEVLRSYCDKESFSVILTFFNRLLNPQLDQVLGPFISTNILVVEERGNGDFEQGIQQTQKNLYEDLAHNHVSGIRALRELKKTHKIPKNLTLPVVFTSLLGHKSGDNGESFLEKVSFSVTQTPQVYLDHQISEYKGELKFSWDVVEGYYALGLIDQVFSDYGRALRMLATDFGQWKTETWKSIGRKIKSARQKPLNEKNVETRQKLPANLCNKTVAEGLQFEVFPDERFTSFPLTDQQQAYAFGRSKYVAEISTQFYMCIEAEGLDIIRLEKAWQKVMETHEMLTAVIQPNGTQRVLEKVPPFRIKVIDLRGRTAETIGNELRRVESSMMTSHCPLGEWPYFDLQVTHINEVKI